MTGAESNGEMETKRNAVSFRGEINSFPFPSISTVHSGYSVSSLLTLMQIPN